MQVMKQEIIARKAGYRNPALFLAWLRSPDAPANEVLDWCYFGFGSGRGTEDSHLQLLAALPIGGDNHPTKVRLAERVAAVLTTTPTLEFTYLGYQSTPEILIYELLSLAGHLTCPDVLYNPLLGIYTNLRESGKALPPLAGYALAKALIHNQKADRRELLGVWLSMTEGRRDPILGGTPELGMEGIGNLPASDDSEKPDAKAVGVGLLNLAKNYQSDEKRWKRFRDQINWLMELWALKPEFFILVAHDTQWVEQGQGWAVNALPDLFVANFGELITNQHCALVWVWYAACLEPWENIQIERRFCGEQVLQVRFSAQTSAHFDRVLLEIKGLARKPDISEAEFIWMTSELMLRTAQELKRVARIQEAKNLSAKAEKLSALKTDSPISPKIKSAQCVA
jgi:hypothetical protein